MVVFFFNDTATTEIYTLSLHDALPICALLAVSPVTRLSVRAPPGGRAGDAASSAAAPAGSAAPARRSGGRPDRKSTRLNSSHANISYAVFCLKKKTISVA